MSPLSGYTPLLQFGLKCHHHHQYYIIIIIIIINYNYYHRFFSSSRSILYNFDVLSYIVEKINSFFVICLPTKHLRVFMNSLKRDRTRIWKYWFLRRGENRSTREKNLSEQRREPNKFNPHIRLATSWPLISSLREKRASTRSRSDEGITNQGKKNKQEKVLKDF